MTQDDQDDMTAVSVVGHPITTEELHLPCNLFEDVLEFEAEHDISCLELSELEGFLSDDDISVREDGSEAGSPLKSGSVAGSPLKSGHEAVSLLTTGSEAGSPLNIGSEAGSPLNSGSVAGSPVKDGREARGPDKSGSEAGSPLKSGSVAGSPLKSGCEARSPLKSGSEARMPVKDGSEAGGPEKSGSEDGSPLKSGSVDENPVKFGDGPEEESIVADCSQTEPEEETLTKELVTVSDLLIEALLPVEKASTIEGPAIQNKEVSTDVAESDGESLFSPDMEVLTANTEIYPVVAEDPVEQTPENKETPKAGEGAIVEIPEGPKHSNSPLDSSAPDVEKVTDEHTPDDRTTLDTTAQLDSSDFTEPEAQFDIIENVLVSKPQSEGDKSKIKQVVAEDPVEQTSENEETPKAGEGAIVEIPEGPKHSNSPLDSSAPDVEKVTDEHTPDDRTTLDTTAQLDSSDFTEPEAQFDIIENVLVSKPQSQGDKFKIKQDIAKGISNRFFFSRLKKLTKLMSEDKAVKLAEDGVKTEAEAEVEAVNGPDTGSETGTADEIEVEMEVEMKVDSNIENILHTVEEGKISQNGETKENEINNGPDEDLQSVFVSPFDFQKSPLKPVRTPKHSRQQDRLTKPRNLATVVDYEDPETVETGGTAEGLKEASVTTPISKTVELEEIGCAGYSEPTGTTFAKSVFDRIKEKRAIKKSLNYATAVKVPDPVKVTTSKIVPEKTVYKQQDEPVIEAMKVVSDKTVHRQREEQQRVIEAVLEESDKCGAEEEKRKLEDAFGEGILLKASL